MPHPYIKDGADIPILQDIDAPAGEGAVSYRIDVARVPLSPLCLRSPEVDGERRIELHHDRDGHAIVGIDLTKVKIYAVVQPIQ